MRWVRLRVLPVPGPATIGNGPGPWRTARVCSGVRPPNSGSPPASTKARFVAIAVPTGKMRPKTRLRPRRTQLRAALPAATNPPRAPLGSAGRSCGCERSQRSALLTNAHNTTGLGGRGMAVTPSAAHAVTPRKCRVAAHSRAWAPVPPSDRRVGRRPLLSLLGALPRPPPAHRPPVCPRPGRPSCATAHAPSRPARRQPRRKASSRPRHRACVRRRR
jgi:hypothetical protein